MAIIFGCPAFLRCSFSSCMYCMMFKRLFKHFSAFFNVSSVFGICSGYASTACFVSASEAFLRCC